MDELGHNIIIDIVVSIPLIGRGPVKGKAMLNATTGQDVIVILDPLNPLAQMGFMQHKADVGTFHCHWETPEQVTERLKTELPEVYDQIDWTADEPVKDSYVVSHLEGDGVRRYFLVADSGRRANASRDDGLELTDAPVFLLVGPLDPEKVATIPDALD